MFLVFINGNNNDRWFPDGITWLHQIRQLQPIGSFSLYELWFQNIPNIYSLEGC